jgi:two-component system, cell cycle response regulator DivK
MILIVDDNDISRMYAEEILKATGANVATAENGQVAVDMVKAGNDFDVILMDMVMPVMDGFEATRLIKRINKKIPVIALTSLSLQAQKQMMIEAGCDKILAKPILPEVLQNAIQEVLNRNAMPLAEY